MDQDSIIIGSHALFYRDGSAITVPGAGVSSRTVKPGAADPLWIDTGIVEDSDIDMKGDEKQVFAPSPGVLRLYDVISTKYQINIDLTLGEMSPLVWELIWGCQPLTPTGANQVFNPLASPQKKGWLKLQCYSGIDDSAVATVDIYGRLMVKSATKFADDIVKTAVSFSVLHSTLNVGTLN